MTTGPPPTFQPAPADDASTAVEAARAPRDLETAVGSVERRALAIEVVATHASLAALRDEWTELLSVSAANTLFLTWEWVATWWQIYERGRLHVVLVRNSSGQLVGIAPLHIVRRKVLWTGWSAAVFLGSGGDVTPEYLDFVVRDGWADVVAPAILDALLASPRIAEIDLQPLAAHSPTLAVAVARLKGAGGITTQTPGPRCPYAVLPPSRAEFLAGRSKNYRKKIGEYERRCRRKYAARFRRSTTREEVTRDLATLRTLHMARWGTSSLAFRTATYVDFHERFAQLMLQKGHLRLYSMESATDGRPLAMSYCLNYAGRYYYYQGGRDPSTELDRTGLVLMHQVIQEAITDGAAVFDFLRGQERYKYRWATGDFGSDRVTHWKSSWTCAAAIGQRAVGALRSMPGRVGRNWRSR